MVEDAVLEILNEIQGDIASVEADMSVLRSDVGEIRVQGIGHTRLLGILQQDTRMIRAAVNDIAKTEVTSGEVEALHHDLNRLQQDFADLAARVEVIEKRPE
jgi:hypothetical protein